MKHLATLLLFLLVSSISVCGYSNVANDNLTVSDSDSVVNIIAYFAKNDTTYYTKYYNKFAVSEGDTTIKASQKEAFMIVVNDSTSDNYLMEYIPLSFIGNTPGNRKYNDDLVGMYHNILRKQHCIFKTDELGKVVSVENWRELKIALSDGIEEFYNAWFESDTTISKTMNKQAVISLTKLSLSEETIKQLCSLHLLFLFHGKTYNIGNYQEPTNMNGYKATAISEVGYAAYEDNPDYTFPYIEVTYDYSIPTSDVMSSAMDVMGTWINPVDAEKREEMKLATDSLIEKSNMVSVKIQIASGYADNGWPITFQHTSVKEFGDFFKQVEEIILECTETKWNGY